MSRPLLSVQADDSRLAALYIGRMLRELPFKTIGDIARTGLELHVYCARCYSTKRLIHLGCWADRCFATARFRCTGTHYDSTPCSAIGMPVMRPAELLPVGGPVTLAFLTCPRCIWEINQVRLDQPPWLGSSQRYRCPGAVAPSTGTFTAPHGDQSATAMDAGTSGGLDPSSQDYAA